MTSGGYRTVSSRATVARFRKHVSPLTGVVTRLERIEADLPLNTNFYAAHNFSAPAQSVNELRAGLTGGSFGKGCTAEQAEASALMEAIERYSGIFQGDEIRVTRRFTDFAPGDAILPNDVLLFSDAQSRPDRRGKDDSHETQMAPAPFDPSARIEWSPVWSLRDGRFKYIPTSLLYFFYSGPAAFHADSNGCAAGNTLEEAIVQGFLELVERDAYAIWWYNRLRRAEVDLSQFNNSYVRDLQTQLAETGRRLWVLDVTSDLGIPTYVAILHWMQNGQENIEFGSGAHFDPRIAMLRTLTELNQFLSIGLMGGGTGEKSSLDGITPLRLEDYPFLTPNGTVSTKLRLDGRSSRQYARASRCLRRYRRASGPRFSRSRSDAARRRGAGRPGDRSRPAAFLSPLRTGPALRCSGQARMAGSAVAGKRTDAVPSALLKGHAGLRAPGKKNKRRIAPPAISARLSGHITLEAQRGRNYPRLLRWPFGRPGEVQRRRREARAGSAHRSAAGFVCAARPRGRQGNRSAGPAIGPERSFGISPRELQATRTGRHRAAASRLLAANAKARRCRNDRVVAVCLSAAARQRDGAGIATRRRVVQDLRSKDRRRPRRAVDSAKNRPVAAAGRLSRDGASRLAGGLPDPVQDRRRQAAMGCGRPRATTTSCSGTFTIFCSTPTARKAGRPIRSAGFIPTPA